MAVRAAEESVDKLETLVEETPEDDLGKIWSLLSDSDGEGVLESEFYDLDLERDYVERALEALEESQYVISFYSSAEGGTTSYRLTSDLESARY